MSLRLAFCGTSAFAVPTLRQLAQAGHIISLVYTQPMRPAGRGMSLQPSPVQRAAEALQLPVRTAATLDSSAEVEIQQSGVEALIVVAYGVTVRNSTLQAVKHGGTNLHPSLLPRWRGAAPIQRAIMRGDYETGVCVMRMEAGLDTGPVCLQERIKIGEMTSGELHDILADKGARLMVEALDRLERGSLLCVPQASEGVTYAAKIQKAEARLNFNLDARQLVHLIHGLSPTPGAWCRLNGKRLKILRALAVDGDDLPGTTVDDRLTIACGVGRLRPLIVQLEGKPQMSLDDFLRGHAVAAGTRLD